MLKKLASRVLVVATVVSAVGHVAAAQRPDESRVDPSNLRIILLGTAGGPTINADRQGISTLVIFLTHLHSDATDIREGVIYDANGVTVTAFDVDHGPVKPALGYRVDYRGHSVTMSGDTRPSDNLVKFAKGTDVLIHEVGRAKDDPALTGPLDEVLPGGAGNTRRQAKVVADHHTDAAEAGQVFDRVRPKLAVLSHANPARPATLARIKETYAGRVEFGTDLMTIDVGEDVALR